MLMNSTVLAHQGEGTQDLMRGSMGLEGKETIWQVGKAIFLLISSWNLPLSPSFALADPALSPRLVVTFFCQSVAEWIRSLIRNLSNAAVRPFLF